MQSTLQPIIAIVVAILIIVAAVLFQRWRSKKSDDDEEVYLYHGLSSTPKRNIYNPAAEKPKQTIPASKNSSSKPAYRQTFEKYYKLGLDLLKTLPGYTGDRFELIPFLAVIGGASLKGVAANPTAYSAALASYVEQTLLGPEIDYFEDRFNFYIDISNGAPVHGFWSISDIPAAVLDVPMLRCAVALGDCITNPDCITDYDNAPFVLSSIADQTQFTQIFSTRFYSLVKSYCTEIVGYDFAPPLLSRSQL